MAYFVHFQLMVNDRLALSIQHVRRNLTKHCQKSPARLRECIGHDQLRDASRFVRITRDYIFTGAVDLVLLCRFLHSNESHPTGLVIE